MNNEKRVVITGCGVASSLGLGVESLWDGLINRRCGVAPISAFDPGGFDSSLGAEVPNFKMTDFVPKSYRKSTKVMARDIALAVVCAYEAAKDANLKTKCLIDRGEAEGEPSVKSKRFGANIGAGLICADLQELAGALQTSGDHETGDFDLVKWGKEGMEHLTPLWLLKFLPNMLGCHVTIVHDAQAPSNTIPCGEASSHLAVGEAFRTVARDAADVCICGGAESKMNPMGVMRQQLIGRLVKGNDSDPATACRPFDPAADGMIAAEGGGLLILEEMEFARARGARIYAEVAGFAAATNATSWTDPDPAGEGIALAIKNALADAGVTSDDVDLICIFGTGCNGFDASEMAGISKVFAGRKDIPAMSIKGTVGTNGAGSGSIDLAAVTMAVHHNTLPPSPNTQGSESSGILRFVQDGPVDANINVALSLAYSLCGNQIAAVVIKKYEG